jgi:MFS transporter, DHA3 family, tetracycline resistance protein
MPGIERILKLYRRNCFLEGFLFSMAWTMHVVFHLQTVKFGAFMIVFMGTLYEIAIMLFEVPTGVVADTISRKLSSVIGWVLLGAGFLIEGLFPVAAVVIGAQLLLGFGETFVSGAHDAWVADEIHVHDQNADTGKVFLKGQQTAFLGRLAGTWTSMFFAIKSLPAVMVAAGIGFVIFGIGAWFWMPEKGFHKSEDQRSFWKTFRTGFNLVRGSQILLLILGAGVIYGLASEGFDRLWNKVFLDAYTLPPVWKFGTNFWWSFFASMAILGGMGLNKLVANFVNTKEAKQVVTAMMILSTVLIFTIAGFALIDSFVGAMVLFVVSRSIRRTLEPLLKTWTNLHAAPEVRATVMSFASQSHSIGEICGGPIVGSIAEYRSAKLAVAVAAAMIAPVLPILGFAKKKS